MLGLRDVVRTSTYDAKLAISIPCIRKEVSPSIIMHRVCKSRYPSRPEGTCAKRMDNNIYIITSY